MRQLSQSIAHDRERLGLTQEQFAQRLGVSQQAVSGWEDGRSLPRKSRLVQLVTILGDNSESARLIRHGSMLPTTEGVMPMGSAYPPQPPVPLKSEDIQALAEAAKQIAQAAQSLAYTADRIAEAVQQISRPQH